MTFQISALFFFLNERFLGTQGNAVFQLQESKKVYKEQEQKGKHYNKKLDELQSALVKHMEQYVNLRNPCLE